MHRRVGRPPNSATEFGWCRSADLGGVAVNLRQLCTATAVIVSAEFLMAEPLPVVPTRTAPESAPANGKPYADKYLSEDTTPIDSSDGTHIARGDESLNGLRQYTAGSSLSTDRSTSIAAQQGGLVPATSSRRATAFLDLRRQTAGYGDFLVNIAAAETQMPTATGSAAGAPADASQRGYRFLAQNMGFPLSLRTSVDSRVGDFAPLFVPPVARTSLYSPSAHMVRGIEGKVFGDDWQIVASGGRRGSASGTIDAFIPGAGADATIGGARKFASGWYLGAQALHTAIDQYDAPTQRTLNRTANVALVGATYEPRLDGLSGRALLVAHSLAATTLFGEAIWTTPRTRHYLYGSVSPPSGRSDNAVAGLGTSSARYRIEIDYPLWSLNAQAGWQTSPPTSAASVPVRPATVDGAIGGKYHWSPRLSFGASAAARSGRAVSSYVNDLDQLIHPAGRISSLSATAFVRSRNVFGDTTVDATRLQDVEVVANGPRASGTSVTMTHDWFPDAIDGPGHTLLTSLGASTERTANGRVRSPLATLRGTYRATTAMSLGGAVSYRGTSSNLFTTQGWSGSLSLDWRPTPSWDLSVRASVNESRVDATGGTAQLNRTTVKSLFVTLRWLGLFGAPIEAAGRTTGSRGTATIRGVVYADLNQNNARDANEPGIGGVEVYVDGREMARTDRDGRFEFMVVRTGPHLLMIRTDSIPLPFEHSREPFRRVDLDPREVREINIPLRRISE